MYYTPFIAICTCCTHIKYLCLYQSLLIFHKKQNHDYPYLYVQKYVVAIFISACIDNPTVHSAYRTSSPYPFSVPSVRQPLQKFVKDTLVAQMKWSPLLHNHLHAWVERFYETKKNLSMASQKRIFQRIQQPFSVKRKNSFPHPSIRHINMYAWIWAYMYCYRYASRVSHTSLRLPLQRL